MSLTNFDAYLRFYYMPTLKKLISCTTKEGPPGKVIYLLQDTDVWFWIKKYVEDEGFATPFQA